MLVSCLHNCLLLVLCFILRLVKKVMLSNEGVGGSSLVGDLLETGAASLDRSIDILVCLLLLHLLIVSFAVSFCSASLLSPPPLSFCCLLLLLSPFAVPLNCLLLLRLSLQETCPPLIISSRSSSNSSNSSRSSSKCFGGPAAP